ncbi:anti-sigma factor [Nocardia puris]|uniref:Regulator of SigK n=1 Tax=Nocardia puris TaxID=208602 RepID=A0A366DVU1_9NOCA|nr:anti-sigma factor [Nocardia puris]MBF6210049.1 anti-sigma factor [Nocardia puris]MBF6368240.1 anti-sigma factor [Nocardia puris]MBF6458041.1 anti-sigma factor [Nocardia puris]RBO94203.1 anti-sigma-K factor RskA [Nocardia puris]
MPDIHSHDELLDLAYPYALDALPDADRRAVEHLLERADEETAAAFRATVRDLRETLASITMVDAVPAPPNVEAALLRALDEQAEADEEDVAPARRPPALRWLAAAAAVLVAVAVGVGIALSRIESTEPGTLTAAEVIAQDDVEADIAPVTGGGTLTVNSSRALGAATVAFDAVATAPEGRTYQVWLIPADGTPRSAAVLDALPSADDPLVMPVEDARTLAVSVEPAGGSPQPTSDPVVAVTFD